MLQETLHFAAYQQADFVS